MGLSFRLMAPSRPPLEGMLVRLRAFEPADISVLNAVFGDPDVLGGVGSMFPQPVAGFEEYVERARTSDEMEAFAIETLADRVPVGGCSMFDIEAAPATAMLGIWIGKEHWSRGYGTDAVRALCRFGFREMNLRRIELTVWSTNERAIRAYEKVGFRREGVLRASGFHRGRPTDDLIMGLLSEELLDGD